MVEQVQYTPQHAYNLLRSEYGIIDATSFAHALVDGRGNPAWLACQLMAWIMDWHRPADGGGPRYHGRLWLPSSELARRWNVSPSAMERARRCISQAGLASFGSVQHTCVVAVDWAAVASALERHRTIVDNVPEKSDPARTQTLNQSDPARTQTILPYTSALKTSPPSEEEEDAVQHTSGSSGCSTPPATLALARAAGGQDLAAAVERMIDYGRQQDRACTGAWVRQAHDAVEQAVAAGANLEIIEQAWRGYVYERGARATDLGHWIQGKDLRGEAADEGSDGYEARYARAQHTRDREREKAEAAAEQAAQDAARATPEAHEDSTRAHIRAVCALAGQEPPDGLDSMTGEALADALRAAMRLSTDRLRRVQHTQEGGTNAW